MTSREKYANLLITSEWPSCWSPTTTASTRPGSRPSPRRSPIWARFTCWRPSASRAPAVTRSRCTGPCACSDERLTLEGAKKRLLAESRKGTEQLQFGLRDHVYSDALRRIRERLTTLRTRLNG